MELTNDELQYLLNAINTHLKEYGLPVVDLAHSVTEKIKENLSKNKFTGDE